MRIGTTSFIHPGGWLFNVERLCRDFDDVEILFFEDGPGAFPDVDERRGLARCKREHGLTYSLHAPLSASLASEDAGRRRAGVESVLRALDVAAPFQPDNVVLHVYHGDGERDPAPPPDLDAWRARAASSLTAIADSGIPRERLCVELLDYDYAWIEPVVVDLGLSVALDVGHLARDGKDELAALQRLWSRARIVQWHGTDGSGRDHRSIEFFPRARALALLDALLTGGYAGVLTLEVFRAADLESSRRVLAELFAELGQSFPERQARGPA
jgi:sugar phosphate isomerase/epimerase